jgi:3-oxoadipate enol-lactonase
MKFATIENITLHFSLEGAKDGVPLVFINSLGTDFRIWDEVVAHLSYRFRLLRFDQRGHGLSDTPQGPYSLNNFTEDLAGLMTHLQIDKAVLVGNSVGGMVAMDFAVRHPQRVLALVLCDTAAKIGSSDYWHDRIKALRESGIAPLVDGILNRWFSPAFAARRPADYRGYANMLIRAPLAGYIATCEAIRDADLREAVRMLTVKTLVLCGSEDNATPPDIVREFAESLPRARFELVAEAGHIPGIEQPLALATRIEDFLCLLIQPKLEKNSESFLCPQRIDEPN